MNRTVTRIIIATLAVFGVVRYVHERAIVRNALDTIARDRAQLYTTPATAARHRKTDGFALIICAVLLACVVFLATVVVRWLGAHS